MEANLQGLRAVCLVHNDFEDLELWYPIYRLQEAGVEIFLAGESGGARYTGKYGVPAVADIGYDDLHSADYDCLLVPGGWAPDKIRRFPEVLAFVRAMDAAEKPIGQICHAGWVLISARILEGRTVTSTPGIKDDMTNAGATWVDQPAVTDGNLVSSRRPPDLPAYLIHLLAVLQQYQRRK